MKRLLGFVAALIVSALIVAPVAGAGERKGAEAAARKAASSYVEQFGIYYQADMWKARCHRKRSSWKCEVESQPPQCSGTLRVQERRNGGFKAYHERIGCAE